MLIDLVMVRAPRPPGSSMLISPPAMVLEIARQLWTRAGQIREAEKMGSHIRRRNYVPFRRAVYRELATSRPRAVAI
jgi:hypothetical protein